MIKAVKKLNAKFSRLVEKEKNAGCLQPHLQRKRDRYLKELQVLERKHEALVKMMEENDRRKQGMNKKRQQMDKIHQEIVWMQKEIEEEFPYIRHLEVKENAGHPMPKVEHPMSAASSVCRLGQEFPSTQLENKENVECPTPHKEKLKESARCPILPVNHALSNIQVEIKEDAECPVN